MTKTEQLRREFGSIKAIDPEGEAFKGLCAFLDARTTHELRDLVKADIPWVSRLAQNRVTRCSVKSKRG